MPIDTERSARRHPRAGRLTVRVFVGVVLVVAAVLGVVLTTAIAGARRTAATSAERGLEQAADLVAQLLAGRTRSLAGGARVFVQGPYFRTLVAERRRDDILDQTFEAAEQLEASWVFITDANGTLVAKSDEPDASGDPLAGVALVSGALRGQITSGFGGSGDSLLFLATAVPINAPGGTPFGVLVATTRLDSTMAADIALATGANVVFYVRDENGRPRITAATMPLDSPARVTLHASLDTTGERRDPTLGQRRAPNRIVWRDRDWYTYASALNTAGGSEVGGYLVVRPVSGVLADASWLTPAVSIAALLGLVLAALAAWWSHRTVAAPLRRLTDAVYRTVDGARDGSQAGGDGHPPASRGAVAELHALTRAVETLHETHVDRERLSRALLSRAHLATVAASNVWSSSSHDASSHDALRAAVPTRSGAEPSSGRWRARRSESALTLPVTREGEAGPLQLAEGAWLAHRYQIGPQLGGGASGVVYRAFDRARGRDVAVQMLRPELLPAAGEVREARFAQVRRVQALDHAHLARVFDVGEALGTAFITSEYIDGITLRSWLELESSLPWPVVRALARQLLRALVAMHDERLVHGDLKPSHVLVTATGLVALTDFGVARLVGRVGGGPRSRAEASVEPDLDPRVSGRVIGATVGTPDYMAPELLIGAPPSPAGDLFAVGVMLFECLRGRTPYGSDTPLDALTERLRDTPGLGTPVPRLASTRAAAAAAAADADAEPARSRPDDTSRESGALEALVAALTAPEPHRRPSSAREALASIE